MNLKPTSEKDNRHFFKFALIFFGLTFLICLGFYISNKYSVNNHQPIAETTTVAKPVDTISLIDSSQPVDSDRSLVDSLELTWGSDRVNIKDALDNIAGVEGSVYWTISYADAKLKNNPDLFTAIGHAINKEHKKPKIFDIKLLVNRQNKRFRVLKAIDNGEVLKGPMVTMSLAIEGGYSQGVSF
jgi:hypothetical protein